MNSIVLRKSGGFYICFDDDAIVVSYLCNYKINNGKVGFPLNTINKVINILENNSISYIVKENMEDVNKKMYGNKNKYKQVNIIVKITVRKSFKYFNNRYITKVIINAKENVKKPAIKIIILDFFLKSSELAHKINAQIVPK